MRPPGKKSETLTKKVRSGEERATGKKGEVKVHVTILVLLKNKLVNTQKCIICDILSLKLNLTVSLTGKETQHLF